ncbi:MAG: DJ-1/PfpI/YhbO family deglycase/protease [Candidatus Geothermincolia bacterium]
MHHLSGKKVIMVLGPQYQDEEASQPLAFLKHAGASVDVAGMEKITLKGLHGRANIDVDKTFDEVDPANYDAMVIPGGRSPANLRKHPEAVELVKRFFDTGKTVAAICHGPQMLAAAGLLQGKDITGYFKIKDEMLSAGVNWHDQPVIIDANLITSRDPSDMKEFTESLEEALTKQPVR